MMQVRGMAEKYFGGWRQDAIPALPPSPSEVLAQPPAGAERYLDSSARGGPALMQAYYRPGIASADAPIIDVIGCAPSSDPCTAASLCACSSEESQNTLKREGGKVAPECLLLSWIGQAEYALRRCI